MADIASGRTLIVKTPSCEDVTTTEATEDDTFGEENEKEMVTEGACDGGVWLSWMVSWPLVSPAIMGGGVGNVTLTKQCDDEGTNPAEHDEHVEAVVQETQPNPQADAHHERSKT